MNSLSILPHPSQQESPYAGECALKCPSMRKGFGNCSKSSAREFRNWGIGRGREARGKAEDLGVSGGRGWDLEGDWGLEGEGGPSIGEAEALGELGVEESPQVEDIVSSASMGRGAKRLTVSLGASCLFDFSALCLAGTLVSAAPCGLGAGESSWAFFPLSRAEWLVLPGTSGRSCCGLHGLLCSLHNGGQPNSHVRHDHLATSNTYSSRFLTPVLAMAIALALIAAHREWEVRSDIKSQAPHKFNLAASGCQR
ncbi:hypothetical protein PoB_007332000 [Plakobranchus ocellatus]|uniref:Uncharacterized protein n=1 Tax=Plakobranchus ocellatus TaxID=259542 RepID=A0AAV4DS10_9GAST|nr:hypothetical protein PoB_007332000 [Plakobranchus ocellatus]